jgi:hypothetical protein
MDMNYRLLSLSVSLLAMAGAAFLSCSRVSEPGLSEVEKQPAPPALVIDQDAPLLLEEPAGTKKVSVSGTLGTLTENGPCFVCHVNYEAEPLASRHAAANVGCVSCHGPSYAHRNDENNTTPPDIMYPPDKTDAACHKCHASHDVPAAKIVTLWLKRYPHKRDARRIVCTDCHGEHRLKVRTVRWDKETGKLLQSGKDR